MTKKIREVRIEGNIAYVPLTQGYEAIIDAADADMVGRWNWSSQVERYSTGAVRTVYAVRGIDGGRIKIRMHRLLLGCIGTDLEADHRDGNGLNNQRHNLRLALHSNNTKNARTRIDNASGVKGVHWDQKSRKWRAQISADGVKTYLGVFECLNDASKAYAEASQRLHGHFGRTG